MVLYSTPTCIAEATVMGADKLLLAGIFFFLAFITFMALRRNIPTKSKIFLIYAHLTFLFFPLVLLTTNTTCGLFCMSCHNSYPLLALYALPTTLIASTIAGLFVIPAFYTLSGRREIKSGFVLSFVRKYSKIMNIKTPKIYVVDKAKPVAFSFSGIKSAIFLSVGLFDVLDKKETEAVLLHELAHIRQGSSMLKFSAAVMRVFSPLSLLAKFHDNGKEEAAADNFAAGVQKTRKYIKSAREKFETFEN